MDVLQGDRRRADHDDLVAKRAGRDLVVVDVREGERPDRAGRTDVIDPGRLGLSEVLPCDRFAGRSLGRHQREALEVVDVIGDSPDHPARVQWEVAVSDSRADLFDDLVAPEDIGPSQRIDLGCRQDDVAGLCDGIQERQVVSVVRLLGELDVVGDYFRPVLGETVDDFREVLARKRIPHVLLVAVEVAESDVVDRDDLDLRGRGLGAADRKPRVDRVELELAKDVRPVSDQAEPRGRETDAEEQRRLQSVSSRALHVHAL